VKKSQAPTWVARSALGCGALAFISMGLPFVWLMLGVPTLALVRSQAWPQASCEVLYTGVQPGVTHSRGGSAYRPLVAYAYTVSGREYISAAFEVQPRDYKNEDDAKAQAATFASGSRWKCYVDPADPGQAVLLRRFNPATLLGLLPGLFPVFGLLMLYAAFSVGRSNGPAQPSSSWLPAAATPEGDIVGSQNVRLAPTSSPLGAFIGLLFANLIWNGITFSFMYLGWHDGGLRKFEPGMLCFLPFPLIGLMLLFSIPYKFLALFNPRPYLTLSRQALRPGESLTLRYELTPFGFRVRRLQLWLKGSEHNLGGNKQAATTHEFYSGAVLDQNRGEEASAGQLTLTIPEGVMHSFEASRYQIRWRIKLVADIPLFPDVEQEFTLTVLPGGRA
jgi:Protein of unknown function (DUF3592)